MTKEVQKAYDKAQDEIAKASQSLRGTEYYDFLCELQSHLECLTDCYKEENPEQFS